MPCVTRRYRALRGHRGTRPPRGRPPHLLQEDRHPGITSRCPSSRGRSRASSLPPHRSIPAACATEPVPEPPRGSRRGQGRGRLAAPARNRRRGDGLPPQGPTEVTVPTLLPEQPRAFTFGKTTGARVSGWAQKVVGDRKLRKKKLGAATRRPALRTAAHARPAGRLGRLLCRAKMESGGRHARSGRAAQAQTDRCGGLAVRQLQRDTRGLDRVRGKFIWNGCPDPSACAGAGGTAGRPARGDGHPQCRGGAACGHRRHSGSAHCQGVGTGATASPPVPSASPAARAVVRACSPRGEQGAAGRDRHRPEGARDLSQCGAGRHTGPLAPAATAHRRSTVERWG